MDRSPPFVVGLSLLAPSTGTNGTFTATTPAEFIPALPKYRLWAGGPASSPMAALAKHEVAANAMHAAMNGKAPPKLDVVKAIITGCGGSEDDLQAFATAWRRIGAVGLSRAAIELAKNVKIR
jgi:hypothetical protein